MQLLRRHSKALVRPLLGLLAVVMLLPVRAQDTTRRETLDEVTVTTQRTPSTTRTVTPTQVVDAEKLEHIGALQLSDAVRQMAGVTLKDYGGVGGIKTVSARGLGSQFSAVTLDGVPVDDSQNGQVDLGRYLLGNAAYVSFSQGQQQESLLTARAYAAGNTLNMETAEPSFWPGEQVKLKAGLEAGSFGLVSPTLQWEQRWSKRLKSSLFVNYLHNDGDYPFSLYNTATGQDNSYSDRRKHSQMGMLTADGNLFYTFGEDNTLVTKLHYMWGKHELPGPVHFHSQALSGQSSNEELAFVQTRWRLERGKWKTQVVGKLRYSYDDFLDTTPGTYAYNTYRQGEGFLSGSLNRSIVSWLELELVADGSLNRLMSNLAKLNDVTRRNLMAAAALHSKFDLRNAHVDIRANLLYTRVSDAVADLKDDPVYERLTPFLSAMVILWNNTTLRAFYKDSYRVPNFGELYFFQLMPPNLRPERARQVNLGITHSNQFAATSCQLTLDAYYNHVTDKIISYPLHSMYYWTTTNIGRVDILGLDVTASVQHSSLSVQINYSYQHAVDHSQEGNAFYGHQIVYTPCHSGGGSLRWEHPWVNLGATAMVVGDRYYMQQNSDKYLLPTYCDIGLSVDRSFDLRLGTLTLRAQILNLLNMQYEVVRSYPMMGRNWRLAITYEF